MVGFTAGALALAGSVYRRGFPDFVADWIALAVALVAVGLATSIVFAWLRGKLHRRVV